MKFLLIEDEPKTVQFIKKGLEEFGYEVEIALDGMTGKHLALRNSYNLIITDIILPEMDGRDFCKTIRTSGIETPILMLSALGSTNDIVDGFECGADDYLTKPFAFQELLARIKSLLKRQLKSVNESSVLKIDDLILNLDLRTVERSSKKIELTAKEFALLEYLLTNQGRVISKAELAKNIWKIDFDTGTNMVEVYVNYLRKKIDRDFETKLLHTQFGMGYVLKVE